MTKVNLGIITASAAASFVKFARLNLSEIEKQELDRLEVARDRFEDGRNPEEMIAEFRSGQIYATLVASLKNASL